VLAQAPAGERPLRRVEVTVGAGVLGGAHMGGADAELRANTSQPQPFLLFTTDTRFAAAPVVAIGVGTALTRRFGVEGRGAFARPELRTSVTGDVEDAPPLTVVERVDHYLIEGAVIVMLDELGLGRATPFGAAGAGYLRQRHEGATVVEQGHLVNVGGGIKYWLSTRPRGALRAAGLRADARVYVLSGGYALENGARRHGAISGSFFMTF
jgi:hypothetical protein